MNIKIKANYKGYEETEEQKLLIQDVLFGPKKIRYNGDNQEIKEYLQNTHRDFNDDNNKMWLKTKAPFFDGTYFILPNIFKCINNNKKTEINTRWLINYLLNSNDLGLINIGTTIAPTFISEIKVEKIIIETEIGEIVLSDKLIDDQYLFIKQ